MVQESPELRAVVQRWLAAVQNKDAAALRNLFSESAYLRYIGSDEAEVWSGPGVRTAYPRHAAELPGFKVDPDVVEAFEEGTVGWASLIGKASFEDGAEPVIRMTWVCTLEAGAWRIIQTHVSVPVPNFQLIGHELTSGLEALLASLEADAAGGSEGTVTIMFTDLEGSTELSEVLNDTTWAGLIQRHHRAVADAVEAEGGRVIKTLGDGTMATFDSARGALRSALAIQRAAADPRASVPLRVRIGVHTGDVVRTSGDYLGHAVNKAARIASAAAGGETMVSQVTRELVGSAGEFAFGEACSCSLKGLDGRHVLVPLIG